MGATGKRSLRCWCIKAEAGRRREPSMVLHCIALERAVVGLVPLFPVSAHSGEGEVVHSTMWHGHVHPTVLYAHGHGKMVNGMGAQPPSSSHSSIPQRRRAG